MEKKRKPVIGFFGMILLLIGLCMVFNQPSALGGGLAIGGGIILVYALLTGNIKLFG